jgi:hypothetical protein
LAPTQGGNGNAPAMRAWQNCWAISQLTPLAEAGSPASPRQIMASNAVSSRGVVRVATAGSRARQASSRRRTSGFLKGRQVLGLLAPTASMIAWPMSAQSSATTVRSSPRPARVALIRLPGVGLAEQLQAHRELEHRGHQDRLVRRQRDLAVLVDAAGVHEPGDPHRRQHLLDARLDRP